MKISGPDGGSSGHLDDDRNDRKADERCGHCCSAKVATINIEMVNRGIINHS